jgi:ferredoxin
MKVIADVARCSGHARCAAVAPDLFILTDDGFIGAAEIPVPPGQADLAQRAVRACPERALTFVGDNGE